MSLPLLRRSPGRSGTRREPARRLLIAAAALTLIGAACGGSTSQPVAEPGNLDAGADEAPQDVLATRTGAGAAAAGGNLAAFGPDQCSLDRPLRLAYVGPDLTEFDDVGLGSLVIEDPSKGIEAYLTEVNANGGIHGRCVQASIHRWSWTDPGPSFGKVCADVLAAQPIIVLSLFGDVRSAKCLAIDAHVPMLGISASVPATVQVLSRGHLFLDDGTAGYLLANSIEVARRSEIVTDGDQVGLLYGPPAGAASSGLRFSISSDIAEIEAVTGSQSFIPGVITDVPGKFGLLELLSAESSVRLLEGDLTTSEQADAAVELDALPDSERLTLGEIEQFYLNEAAKHRDRGVVAVFSTAPWFELRRMMRAAERVDWHPRWVASDIQGATLTLTGAPAAQADNFFLTSARRAAGDAQAEMDRGCVSLRNSALNADPFGHRHHSDAWGVLVATCDALDVVVSALSRISGPFSAEALVEQLAATQYETGYGGRLEFGPDDFSGADRFRVLQADPDCVLDEWGCMRAVTGWLAPSAQAPREDQ